MSTLPGVDADPFFYSPIELHQMRDSGFNILEKRIEEQCIRILYYSTGGKIHAGNISHSSRETMRALIGQRVKRLPSYLAKHPTTKAENFLPQLSEGLEQEMMLKIPEINSFFAHTTHASSNGAAVESLDPVNVSLEDFIVEDDFPDFPPQESEEEGPALMEAESSLESLYQMRIESLRGVEEELRVEINGKKREISYLKNKLDQLGLEINTDFIDIDDSPKESKARKKRKIEDEQSGSMQEMLSSRVKSMEKYITTRERESSELSQKISMFKVEIKRRKRAKLEADKPVEEKADLGPYSSWFPEQTAQAIKQPPSQKNPSKVSPPLPEVKFSQEQLRLVPRPLVMRQMERTRAQQSEKEQLSKIPPRKRWTLQNRGLNPDDKEVNK